MQMDVVILILWNLVPDEEDDNIVPFCSQFLEPSPERDEDNLGEILENIWERPGSPNLRSVPQWTPS